MQTKSAIATVTSVMNANKDALRLFTGCSETVLVLLLLQVSCHSVSGQYSTADERFDLALLARVCRSQPVVDQCSPTAQFCSEVELCPQRHLCSCQQNCGNLTCVLPDNIKVCGCHPVPQGGYIIQRADELTFRCDLGFQLAGTSKKHCIDGVWQPVNEFPQCRIVECGSFRPIAHGFVLLNSAKGKPTFNTTASLRCNIGYTLVGNSETLCQADGKWTMLKGSCQRDGVWLPWSSWSSCDVQCAYGLQRRTRKCRPPEAGGYPCDGDLTKEIQLCNTGVPCETKILNCYSSDPWADKPVVFQFDHPSLRGDVHRCLHHCKLATKNYGVVSVGGKDGCWCFDTYKATEDVLNCTSKRPHYELYAIPQGRCTKLRHMVVREVMTFVEHYQFNYAARCYLDFLGWTWRMCNRTATRTRLAKRHLYRSKAITVEC